MSPRKSRKKIVGKVEDVERADSERQLLKLENELHKASESQGEVPAEAIDMDELPDERDT